MENKNEIRKLEELGLGELRGKGFETRIEMFEAIKKCNKGITFDRRTCQLFIDGNIYILVSKRKNKMYYINSIFCEGIKDEYITEDGIKGYRQWLRFYK